MVAKLKVNREGTGDEPLAEAAIPGRDFFRP